MCLDSMFTSAARPSRRNEPRRGMRRKNCESRGESLMFPELCVTIRRALSGGSRFYGNRELTLSDWLMKVTTQGRPRASHLMPSLPVRLLD